MIERIYNLEGLILLNQPRKLLPSEKSFREVLVSWDKKKEIGLMLPRLQRVCIWLVACTRRIQTHGSVWPQGSQNRDLSKPIALITLFCISFCLWVLVWCISAALIRSITGMPENHLWTSFGVINYRSCCPLANLEKPCPLMSFQCKLLLNPYYGAIP